MNGYNTNGSKRLPTGGNQNGTTTPSIRYTFDKKKKKLTMKQLLAFFLTTIIFNSCNKNMSNGQTIIIKDYLYNKKYIEKNDNNKIEFRIVSNPYQWDEKDTLIIYINNKISYVGNFKLGGFLYTEPIYNELIHCKLEIIRSNKLYIFEDKSNFNWKNKFKYIYVGIFSDNSTSENVHFFPQEDQIIQ